MFVKSILKRSSTVIVDEDPVYCPSCSSHRMTRIRRTNFDIRLGVQKRFECGTCYRFALVSGQGNVAEENTTLVDSKADKEEGLSPISQCDLELQQANDQLRSELQLAKNEYERTFAEKTESADEDLDKLRVALEAAKAELSDNEIQIELLRSELDEKSKSLATVQELLPEALSQSNELFSQELLRSAKSVGSNPAKAHGFIDTLYSMGLMYAKGRGVVKDEERAFLCLLEAAERGHASAKFNVAVFLIRGVGTEKDTNRGLKWLQEAATQGHDKSAQLLVKLEKRPGR